MFNKEELLSLQAGLTIHLALQEGNARKAKFNYKGPILEKIRVELEKLRALKQKVDELVKAEG
jgi:hypothetical protein